MSRASRILNQIRHRRTVNDLLKLTDRELRDIGLPRHELERALHGTGVDELTIKTLQSRGTTHLF